MVYETLAERALESLQQGFMESAKVMAPKTPSHVKCQSTDPLTGARDLNDQVNGA